MVQIVPKLRSAIAISASKMSIRFPLDSECVCLLTIPDLPHLYFDKIAEKKGFGDEKIFYVLYRIVRIN